MVPGFYFIEKNLLGILTQFLDYQEVKQTF